MAYTKNASIRWNIIVSFILLMLATLGIISAIMFSKWLSSADEAISKMAKDMNKEISNWVDLYVDISSRVNEEDQGRIGRADEDGNVQGVFDFHVMLTRLNKDLKKIAENKDGFAVIVEKESGQLLANSLGIQNFKILKDGTIKSQTIADMNNRAISQGYENYRKTGNQNFKIDAEGDEIYAHLSEYQKNGLDWLVITAIPASASMTGIFDNMKLMFILMIAAILLSSAIYFKLTNKLLRPIDNLIAITEKFSQEDLSQRAALVRSDEIGRLAESFNKMEDTICTLINNLEEKVRERTLELEKANKLLKENKDQLQLILDSTAEGIYGVDINGKCIFCNESALRMLGYKHQDELIGKNMHLQIHHSDKDGRPIPEEECKIFQAFLSGKGIYADDEVFWRSDGTSFDVEYYSYPQYKDGKIVGAVITFIDNTERKKNEKHIRYLSYYDPLTGVYNRFFFEDELKRLDTKKNLPISIIFGDINHLKLTNDIFGHTSGDALLKKTAQVLKSVCREEDIIARVGGDEFAILLPNTEAQDARKIIDRIKNELSKEKILAVKCSMAMGYDTKTSSVQKIDEVVKNAENQMYREKIFNQQAIRLDMLNTIIEALHHKSPREKQHSTVVSELCEAIGRAMRMPETEVRKVREAAFMHDIGKVILDEALINKNDKLTEEEKKEMQQHPVVGYRILNLCDETLDLAEGVLSHHERWDGTGYPKGLKGEEISKAARIIAVAEAYEKMTNPMNKNAVSREEALEEIKKRSGTKFDPEVVNIFIEIMSERFRK